MSTDDLASTPDAHEMAPAFTFSFHNTTQIHFGAQALSFLDSLLPAEARVLVMYGGGSIKRNGIHARVLAGLHGRTVFEHGGVSPNPAIEDLYDVVRLAKAERIDQVIAVGGGSVIDASKLVAAAALYDGDAWEIVAGRHQIREALPVGVVLTIPATGSESNTASVISRRGSAEKLVFHAAAVRPRFALLDPSSMSTLPDRQLQNGLVDAFVHACEQYLTYPVDALVQDGYAEAVLKTLWTLSKRFDQRHSRAWTQNLMWAANQALGGILGVGVPQDWSTHRIAADFTALYDIDHARALSIVQPSLLRETIDEKREKLEQMGREVFGHESPSAIRTIDAIEAMYRSLDMPVRFSDTGLPVEDVAQRLAAALQEHGVEDIGERRLLDRGRILRIVEAACRSPGREGLMTR